MTDEKAKEVLQEQIDKYGQEYDAEGIEALEIAIKRLEHPELNPSYNGVKSELKPCDDCISREAVIKIFGEVHPLDYNKQSYIANIKKLPSVTPKAESKEQYKADLQGAYDCGYNCGYTDAMSDIYERGENE